VPHTQPYPLEVDRDHAVEGFLRPFGGLLPGRFDLPAGDAGIVECAVEPTIGPDHAFDHRADIRVARHIAPTAISPGRRRVHLGDGFAGGFGRDVGDCDARAFARKRQGRGAANPAASTRNQCRFPVEQPGHRSPLPI